MYGQSQWAPASAPLVTFGVNSQGVWRLRFDLIHAYKMMFGLLDTDVHVFFTLNNTDVTRSHCYNLYVAVQMCASTTVAFIYSYVLKLCSV